MSKILIKKQTMPKFKTQLLQWRRLQSKITKQWKKIKTVNEFRSHIFKRWLKLNWNNFFSEQIEPEPEPETEPEPEAEAEAEAKPAPDEEPPAEIAAESEETPDNPEHVRFKIAKLPLQSNSFLKALIFEQYSVFAHALALNGSLLHIRNQH